MVLKNRYAVKIVFENGVELRGELVKHYAPRVVEDLLYEMPFNSRAFLHNSLYVYFQAPVSTGPQNVKKYFKRKDLVFWPAARAICIVLKDFNAKYPMCLIGEVKDDVSGLESMKRSMTVSIQLGTEEGSPSE